VALPHLDPVAPAAAVLLGVDVGGSHTAVVLARGDGTMLGRAEGPGAALRPGEAAATAVVVAELVRRAAHSAGVTLPADRAVVGCAGAGRPLEQGELLAALSAYALARRLEVTTDGEIALVAAFGLAPGILVSAGTGSIAYARDHQGQLHRAGGYGWQLGDEGGGYWIGRQALAAVARQRPRLLARLLRALAFDDFRDLVRWAATATPPQIAALAPHVLDAAQEGDPDAQHIVAAAARELGHLVLGLVSAFPPEAPAPVAVAGALLRPGSPLRVALQAILRDAGARLQWTEAAVDGPVGAVRLAAALPSR
jgi:N-acetylglucosamine kinase-like BadF-type ATPase